MHVDRRSVLKGIGGSAAVAIGARASRALEPELAPIVSTTYGPVSGYWAQTSPGARSRVAAFKGIPYGADTRTTRFRAPASPAAWTSPLPCSTWAPRAPQQVSERRQDPLAAGYNAVEAPVHFHLPEDQGVQSEDCLHLNIWTPRAPSTKGRAATELPVLFYIHGGAYNNGTVNAALYDGTRLAERGEVVVVTVNHRLNAFGYLYLAGQPGLGAAYPESGNAGMVDLVLALQWVRDNIAAFGGDPSRVTIFGQSGGGAKCATLMAMPAAAGLFHRVWTMSGQQVWAAPAAKASRRAEAALRAMGVDPDKAGGVKQSDLDGLTVQQVQAGARSTNDWLPVRDNVVLPRDPFDPDAPPQSNRIPMVLGNTHDEIYGATAWQRAKMTWDELPGALEKPISAFKGPYTVDQIVAAYRGWYPAYTPNDVFTAALACFRSWPGQVIEAERRASHPESAQRTWVYQMDYPSPTADGRAPHTLDIPFVFDNLRLSPGMVGDTPEDIARAQGLATDMSTRLIAFARAGVPGAGWPVYDLRERRTMMFDRLSKVDSNPRGREREMMVGAHYRQPGT